MIRVKAVVDKWGRGKEFDDLGELEIINDGSGSPRVGNYRFVFKGSKGQVISEGVVRGHLRSAGAWPLIQDCLSLCEVYAEAAPRFDASKQLAFEFSSRPVPKTITGVVGTPGGKMPRVA